MSIISNVQVANMRSAWPKKYSCRFIEPGLVNYSDYGNVLVKKEVLDKMANTFIGKPVINEIHKKASPDNFEEVADGVVTDVKYNAADGWWEADFIVWDEATKKNCESKAYSVSCAYDVTNADSRKGEHNNIPYEQTVLDGKYTHLAIVSNPRYEGARIILNNSKGGSSNMNLKFWEKGKGVQNAKEIPLENATFKVGAETIKIKDLIEKYKTVKLKNSTGTAEITPETVLEIEGEEVTIQQMIEATNSDEKLKEDEEDDKKKKEDMENAENCGDCKTLTPKNALVTMENANLCVTCTNKKLSEATNEKDGEKHFNRVKELANRRGEPQQIKVVMPQERQELGRQKYGSTTTGGK